MCFPIVERDLCRADRTAMALGSMGAENNERRWIEFLHRRLPAPTGHFDHFPDFLIRYVLLAILARDRVLRTIDDRSSRNRIGKLSNVCTRCRTTGIVPRSVETCGESRPKTTQYRIRPSRACCGVLVHWRRCSGTRAFC